MNRTAARRIASVLAALLSLAPLRALADDARELDDGITVYLSMALRPGSGSVEGCARLERLAGREPRNPVYLAYAGACQTVVARDAKVPDDQARLAMQGIERVEQALAMLAPAHDDAELRGVPQSIEVRLVAAEVFTSLPPFFNLRGAGQAAAAAAMASPAWARTPDSVRARVEHVTRAQGAEAR
jgi:hypothetical protein